MRTNLFIDLRAKRFVRSLTSAETFTLPEFCKFDRPNFTVKFLQPAGSGWVTVPFTTEDVTPLDMQMTIGTLPATILAAQVTWTKDEVNDVFTGEIDLNTTEMNAALAAASVGYIDKTFEILVLDGGDRYTIQQTVRIRHVVNAAGAPAPVVYDPPSALVTNLASIFLDSATVDVVQVGNTFRWDMIGGPFLPLAGGTLTGLLSTKNVTFAPTTAAGGILVTGSATSVTTMFVRNTTASGGSGSEYSVALGVGGSAAGDDVLNTGHLAAQAGLPRLLIRCDATNGYIDFAAGGLAASNVKMRIKAASRVLISSDISAFTDDGSAMLQVGGPVRIAGRLTFSDTTYAGLRAQNLSTIQRDALVAVSGDIIFNGTNLRLEGYENGAWIGLSTTGAYVARSGDTMTGGLAFSGSTIAGIRLNNVTTAQRDALSGLAGQLLWNTTTSRPDIYSGSAWSAIPRLDGDTFTGKILFSGTGHAGLQLNSLTTAQRDALTAANGDMIYNTTLGSMQVYQAGVWGEPGGTYVTTSGDTMTGQLAITLTSATGLVITATGQLPADLIRTDAGTTTSVQVERWERLTSGTAAAGLGGYASHYVEDDAGAAIETSRIESLLTAATAGAVTAPLAFSTRSAGTLAERMRLTANLHLGGSTEPTSLVKGLVLSDGTAASADPTTAAALWSASGVLQYRTSGASEGSGITNRLHNRAAIQVGVGTAYSLTNAYARAVFGTTNAELTLPTAGTYIVHATVTFPGNGVLNSAYAKFYDSTAAADIANTERITRMGTDENGVGHQLNLWTIYTVTVSSAIQIYAKGATADGSITSTETSMTYVRLY